MKVHINGEGASRDLLACVCVCVCVLKYAEDK